MVLSSDDILSLSIIMLSKFFKVYFSIKWVILFYCHFFSMIACLIPVPSGIILVINLARPALPAVAFAKEK